MGGGEHKPNSKQNEGPAMKRPIDPRRVLQILEIKRRVSSFVESMLEPNVSMSELRMGEEIICKRDYDSIVQEREILKICGYPLCPNKLIKEWKQRYQICLRDQRVHDVEVRKLYCSIKCMDASTLYRDQHIPDQPIWMRPEDFRDRPSANTMTGMSTQDFLLSQFDNNHDDPAANFVRERPIE